MEILTNNFISDFFLIVLRWIYSIVNDYSIAIILLTFLIKLAMLPLDIKQRKSSMRMAAIKPELDSLKKRYSNDPQLMNKRQQELYRSSGVKPLAGCLPAVLSMFILFPFFGMLRVLAAEQTIALFLHAVNAGATSVQLPQWLWVHNLWQPDSGFSAVLPSSVEFLSFIKTNATYISPQTLSVLQQGGLISFDSAKGILVNADTYNNLTNSILSVNGVEGLKNGWFILPVLAGVSMFFSQSMSMKNNAQMQQQGKMMLYIFPAISILICASSNTAFALYWTASNVFTLGQYLIIGAIAKTKEVRKI